MVKRPEWTGERYLPWIGGSQIHYEHLHRYRFVASLVTGKSVIDLACGEGYGSGLLAEKAGYVLGVDIDRDVVRHAASTYGGGNLDFCAGSLMDLPVKSGGIFDVVVCFEAIEHILEQDQLLKEVKRLLKPEGLFVVSTPNKTTFSDNSDEKNPYHLKELYFEDFSGLLETWFDHTLILGQAIFTGSSLFPLKRGSGAVTDYCITKDREGFKKDDSATLIPDYFVAVVSDHQSALTVSLQGSYLIDNSTTLLKDLKSDINGIGEAMKEKETLLERQRRAIEDLTLRNQALENELSRVTRSKMWQLTLPFRKLMVWLSEKRNGR